MVRSGQALYLSAAGHAVMIDAPHHDNRFSVVREDDEAPANLASQKRGLLTLTGKKSFRVFALSTFRAFFLQLAWSTNYTMLMSALGCTVTFFLLSSETFGNSFSLSSTLIVLLSLKDFTAISHRLLELISVMSKGCLVLTDVAELLNTDSSICSSESSEKPKEEQHHLSTINESGSDVEDVTERDLHQMGQRQSSASEQSNTHQSTGATDATEQQQSFAIPHDVISDSILFVPRDPPSTEQQQQSFAIPHGISDSIVLVTKED